MIVRIFYGFNSNVYPSCNFSAQRNQVYYPRSNAKLSHARDARKATDQSVEMERLAEKYLGQSKPIENKMLDYTFKNSGSVEMSMSSQQYLERYGLDEYAESSSR